VEDQWSGATSSFNGEYFCFDGGFYIGTWNGRFDSGGWGACLERILSLPLRRGVVSRDQPGTLTGANSARGSLSIDGAQVAYSNATRFEDTGAGLVALSDVFVFDRRTGRRRLVSANAGGIAANGSSNEPALELSGYPDAEAIAFSSTATNLVPGDTGENRDVFLKEMGTGLVRRLSDAAGNRSCGSPSFVGWPLLAYRCEETGSAAQAFIRVHDLQTQSEQTIVSVAAPGHLGPPALAGERHLAFASSAAHVAADTNGLVDIYAFDLQNASFELVSRSLSGGGANGASRAPSISFGGCRVAFESDASNLVGGDANGRTDVFVRDLCTGETLLASRDAVGAPLAATSRRPSISPDGSFVAFETDDLALAAQAGLLPGATVVAVAPHRFGAPRAATTGGIAGHAFDFSAAFPVLSAPQFSHYAANGDLVNVAELLVHAEGSQAGVQLAALPSPFIVRSAYVFVGGFE
jgi:Tol biopolymer transport system component